MYVYLGIINELSILEMKCRKSLLYFLNYWGYVPRELFKLILITLFINSVPNSWMRKTEKIIWKKLQKIMLKSEHIITTP